MRILIAFVLVWTVGATSHAQQSAFGESLAISGHAALSGLGGRAISHKSNEANFVLTNPAQLSFAGSTRVSVSQYYLPAGITMSSLGLASQYGSEQKKPFFVSFRYLDYGDFDAYNEFGELLQEDTRAYDLSLKLGGSYELYDRMTVGVSIGLLNTSYADLGSTAITTDLGAVYQRDSTSWRIALAVQNLGFALENFEGEDQYHLPTNVSLGFSKKLEHLPFTFFMTYHHLQQWNLEFDNPYEEETALFLNQGGSTVRNDGFFSMFVRHINLGGEFALGAEEKMKVRVGFDFNRNQIVSIPNQRTLSGLSLGVGFKIRRSAYLDYSYSVDHYISNTHNLSLSLDIFAKGPRSGLLW